MLVCPKCQKELRKDGSTYCCPNGHRFDIAKQGYVNLFLKNQKQNGDDTNMIHARRAFLETGAYENLKDALIEAIQTEKADVLVDAGCGEGYYTHAFGSSVKALYGFDLSKSAIRLASSQDKEHTYAIASIAHLPLANASVDCLVSVFAPCDEKEFYRVLKPGGLFLKVEPAPYHLYELKEMLYENVRLNEADAKNYQGFRLEKEMVLDRMISVRGKDMIQALFQMTPYYWKTSAKAAKSLTSLSELVTRTSFHIEWYRKEEIYETSHADQ